ncbi:MAG: ABC transporter substrate-binding protein, partial [Spirochaetaceae bacterium]|nr:ABC transporter substrate-binding protein [Spirochaetaceae bacterium]
MKRLLFLVLCIAVSGALWATGTTAKDDGPMTIKFWTHEDPNRTEIEERYIREFEAANPGVTIERVTNASAKTPELLLTAFAANEGPHI